MLSAFKYCLYFWLIDAVNSFLKKRIHNTFQIRGDKTQRQQNFFKNKVKFVDYRMKWIVLSYSESYFEETKYILVKFQLFSCNQEYY